MPRMTINGQTQSAARRRNIKITIVGDTYEARNLKSNELIATSTTSASQALRLCPGAPQSRSVIDRPWKDAAGKKQSCDDLVARELAKAIKNPITGAVDDVRLNLVCKANDIDPKRWQHLNTGLKRIAVGCRLRGMLSGSKRSAPRQIVIKGMVISPGDDLT